MAYKQDIRASIIAAASRRREEQERQARRTSQTGMRPATGAMVQRGVQANATPANKAAAKAAAAKAKAAAARKATNAVQSDKAPPKSGPSIPAPRPRAALPAKPPAPKKAPGRYGDIDSMSFGQAFKAMREAKGKGKTFTWRGKKYTTDRADD